MRTTIAAALASDCVELEELEEKYGPLQSMIKELLGTVPNSSRYLEIWPPAFRTLNLLVASFLNLPMMLFGFAAPKEIVGLVMYATSRTNKCSYCVAHSCSFALRRGTAADVFTEKDRSDRTQSAMAVAEALSSTPHKLDAELRESFENHFGPDNADWLALASVLMNFLNKVMDSIQVELEIDVTSEVSPLLLPTGWRPDKDADSSTDLPAPDSVGTYLRILLNAPGMHRMQSKWLSGMPADAVAARAHIAEIAHWDEPLLSKMRHAKPRLALAVSLRENLCMKQSTLDIGCKALAGIVFAGHIDSDKLRAQCEKLGESAGVEIAVMKAVSDGDDDGLEMVQACVVRLARLLSSSPPRHDEEVLVEVTGVLLNTQLVETVVWLSLLQMIYRLGIWYEIE